MDTASPFINPKLLELKTQHRKIDAEIARLQEQTYADQITIQRLKKEKLRLKDKIEQLKDDIIPDLNA
jgi:hypothetical protein